jgi:hypothetical protein
LIVWDATRIRELYELSLRHLRPSELDEFREELQVVERWFRSSDGIDDELVAAIETVAGVIFREARRKKIVEQ